MAVDQKTLDDIFKTEGISLGISEVHLQEQIPKTVCAQVCPQDVVDAVRHIKENGLLAEGKSIFTNYAKELKILRYELPLKSTSNEQGRTVPNLKLQLVKDSNKPVKFHGQLYYHWSGKDHYFCFFDLKN